MSTLTTPERIRQEIRESLRPVALVESCVPTIVFVATFRAEGTRAAALISLGVGLLFIVARLARRQSPKQAVSGMVGLAISVAFSGTTGSAKGFFLPEIIGGALWSLLLLSSVARRRPLIGTIVGAVWKDVGDWRERPLLRQAFTRITLVDGLWALAKATLQLSFYLADEVDALAGAKLLLGYPPVVLIVLYAIRLVRGALARERLVLA